MGHPHGNGHAALFVPVPGSEVELPPNLKKGAAIVGFGNPNGTLTIYFESNRFNENALHLWEAKLQAAFRRMIEHLPTTSKAVLPPHQFEQVGLVSADGFRVTRFESLKRWLAYSQASDSAPENDEKHWN